jgi:ATP-dependent DNA helicase PIF1
MKQIEALEILKTGSNVFLTGAPGAGKTHVINEYIKYLKSYGIYPDVTASTGIAATHIGGVTIHSWSGLGIVRELNEYHLDKIMEKESAVKRVKNASVLIIDEISMLDAQTLNNIDLICRTARFTDKSFGGLQIIFVGDFFQLPPINKEGGESSFAFESLAFQNAKPLVCYIDEQYRQDDVELLDLLVAIRQNKVTEVHLEILDYAKKETQKNKSKLEKNITRLYTHNKDVDDINSGELDKLDSNFYEYEMETVGKGPLIESLKKSCLSPETLRLKVDAKVIFTKNDKEKKYVNGSLGTVSYINAKTIKVKLDKNDHIIDLEKDEWSIEENGKIRAKIMQYPLRLAWAITVHKSQGMSLDSAFMDLSRVFEYGQGYVALSRVRSLSGLYIEDYNEKSLQIDSKVYAVDKKFINDSKQVSKRFLVADKDKLSKMQKDFILRSGGEFNFTPKPVIKIDTFTETLNLIEEGKTFDEIIKIRQVTKSTIVTHFERLLELEKINLEQVLKIIPKKYTKIPSEIKKSFKTNDTSKISNIYKEFAGEYEYDEINFFKLIYLYDK